MYKMNYLFELLVPCIFILSFAFALFKKVKIYDSFAEGVKQTLPMILSIFPYIATVTILCKLFEISGLESLFAKWLSPVFSFFGVPQEISPLVLIKPLSGSGAIAVLTEILERYGVDSYIARCACVSYGSSETIFYIGAVYFAGIKRKKLTTAFLIAVFSYLASVVFCCFLCRIM